MGEFPRRKLTGSIKGREPGYLPAGWTAVAVLLTGCRGRGGCMATCACHPCPAGWPAPSPGWAETTDVVVVGSGIAGLTCALHLREAGLHVTVVTKVNIDDGSTRWAQGGIAAVLDPLDTPAAHAEDTLVAGVGLCDPAAVDVLVDRGPDPGPRADPAGAPSSTATPTAR